MSFTIGRRGISIATRAATFAFSFRLAIYTPNRRRSLPTFSTAKLSYTTSREKMTQGADIEDIWKDAHRKAMELSQETYVDPATGYTVFTELSHKKRGYCCGNRCRHCPYDYENVGKPERIREQAAAARKSRKKV